MRPINEKLEAFARLLKIMDELREQCPWDKKQTIQSLRHLTLEETYELADAILKEDMPEIKKELGDILLHIVFYARIASETQDFDIADVIHALCDKLIKRHPHIYGNVKADDEETVKKNWEQIKLSEGNRSVLSGVPNAMPALIKAYRIQEKARGVGFDWDNKAQVWQKVEEEIQEFKDAEQQNDTEKMEEELGDLFFAYVNYARFLHLDPETALEKTNQKFISRFQYIEEKAKEQQKSIQELSLEEMEFFWQEAKAHKKNL
ncbi:MAG: nucleoside triphosphate pyrophosphohydrolase [Cytophagales bacterium]|nr:MAG: nucleoside triphosphate pyrophosphohydrolase [Cytophagales bacterium]